MRQYIYLFNEIEKFIKMIDFFRSDSATIYSVSVFGETARVDL